MSYIQTLRLLMTFDNLGQASLSSGPLLETHFPH